VLFRSGSAVTWRLAKSPANSNYSQWNSISQSSFYPSSPAVSKPDKRNAHSCPTYENPETLNKTPTSSLFYIERTITINAPNNKTSWKSFYPNNETDQPEQ